MNGLLLIAVAAAAARLPLTAGKQKLLAWSLVLMAYGNFIASTIGATFGVRGLEPVGPAVNLVVYGIFFLAVIGVFVGIWLLAGAARRASRS